MIDRMRRFALAGLFFFFLDLVMARGEVLFADEHGELTRAEHGVRGQG